MDERLYRINDVLTALAQEFGAEPTDDTLNELTHLVGEAFLPEPKSGSFQEGYHFHNGPNGESVPCRETH